ncbi:MAG: signal peptide peptidase SppA [Xanthomonadaceae bacterium]|jgi:protease-4|nr:signal peptide peptidase SppA [Xanthomonadaceae bacterium]
MNQPTQRSFLFAFFGGLWTAINFTRQLILNMLFFGFLFLVVVIFAVAMMRGGGVKSPQDRTTLVIAPEGRLVEQYSTDPITRALSKAMGDKRGEEIQLRDLLRALEEAKNDARIERVLLRVDKLSLGGFASLREIASALSDLRGAGKQIIAFGETFDQRQYLLAAQADEIYLDPMGGMVLEGLSRYRQYVRRGLQDKLGVDMYLYRAGEFKSAGEPFILDRASPEAKEADLYWMSDLWQRYLEDVAEARNLDVAQLAASVDKLPEDLTAANGDLSNYAVQQKWVDGLKTQAEVERLMAERGVADSDAKSGFRNMTLDEYLLHLDSGRNRLDGRPQVAVVVAEGGITEGDQAPGKIGGISTSALLRRARDDSNVRAVVLRVNSPGGEVFPSEQIRREVVALKEAGKPVVVSMGDVAASGGYWISMNADKIYADDSTISGSIGIFGLIPNFTRTLDKIGVHTDGVGTSRLAGAFDPTKPFDPAIGEVIQSVIDKGYADFTGKVADARSRSVEDIDAVARGRVWSGAQAKERGLIDELGGLRAAIAAAAEQANLGDSNRYRVRYIEKDQSPFSQFTSAFIGSRLGAIWLKDSEFAQALLMKSVPGLSSQWSFIEEISRNESGAPIKAVAHCLCEP